MGTDIWAAAPGTVAQARTGWNGGWGNYVLVDHGDGTFARYAHLIRIDVEEGWQIERGRVIGGEGNTGDVQGATGIHLHFQIEGSDGASLSLQWVEGNGTPYTSQNPGGGGGSSVKAIIDSITPQHPYGGQTIHFRGHGTCAAGYSITGYEWWSAQYDYVGNGASVDRSLPVGSHTISFRVQRSDGLWSDRVYWPSNPLVVDPHTSVATIDSITPQRPYDGQTIQFNGHGTCVSGHAITDYEWWSHEHGYVGGSASVSVKLPAGSHTISFRTKCSGGEWSAPKYWTGNPLVVKPHTVTAVIDSVTPLSPYRGQTVKLSGHGSCNVGHVGAVYQWYSTLDGIIGASDMVYTQDLSVGEHTIKFRVQCTGGRLSAWQAFAQKVVVREPPGGTDWRIAIDPPLPAAVQGAVTVTGYAQELAGPRHIEAIEIFVNGKVLTWNANFDATTGRWSYVWDTSPRAGEVVILLVRASDGSFWVDDTAVVEILPMVHATANIAPGTWLMGLPVVPAFPDAAHVLATGNVTGWDATTQTYRLYQAQPFNVASGYGYWASYDALQALDIAGAYAAGPVTCDVAPGWNLLGNPYDQTLAWSNVDGNGKLEPFAWRQSLDGSTYELVSDLEGLNAVQTIPRWRGMWVWATGAGTVSLNETAPAQSTPSPPVAAWSVRLIAGAGRLIDASNYVGQMKDNAALQATNPPLIGKDYVDLYMLDAQGRHQAVSLAAAGGQTTWDVCVETNLPGATVTVRFPDLSAVPRDLAVMLTDVDAGRTINMRTSAGYSFTSGQGITVRHLRIAATPRTGPALTLSGVAVQSLSESVSVAYSLSAPADVQITVLNIAGRTVANIPVGYQTSGTHTSTWSRRNSTGSKVPAGQYLLRLRCRADDGTDVSQIAPAVVQ
jgi:hypothetical protein